MEILCYNSEGSFDVGTRNTFGSSFTLNAKLGLCAFVESQIQFWSDRLLAKSMIGHGTSVVLRLWIVFCLRTIWWDTECCCPADLSKITSLYEFSLEQWMPSDNDTVNASAYWKSTLYFEIACVNIWSLMSIPCITFTFGIAIWEILSCSGCIIVSSVLFIPNESREGKQDTITYFFLKQMLQF